MRPLHTILRHATLLRIHFGAVTLASTLLCLLTCTSTSVLRAASPEPPRVFVDTSYRETGAGAVTYVPAGGNLQVAINAAQPGDTIVLEPSATYVGAFTLPPKSGTGVITIQSLGLSR